MRKSRQPRRSVEEIERATSLPPALLVGRVRIALAALGPIAVAFMPGVRPLLPALLAYLALALAFQQVIARRMVDSVTRSIVMGIADLSFVTYLVHQLGSLTFVLPMIYVVVPVLYATTTSRRRVAGVLTAAGLGMYATTVALEQAGVLPYAPSGAGQLPPGGTALMTVALVATCAAATALPTARLIAALGRANARLRELSQRDELTALFNRRYVTQRLEEELARLGRRRVPLMVAMVDLDGFKRVNDEVGHEAGDAVLLAVAAGLLEATRKGDVVARYGGDEFVVLLPNSDLEGARAVGQRMLDAARSAAAFACPGIPVAASIGLVECVPGDTATEVLRRVDEKLYQAKRAGGDRIA